MAVIRARIPLALTALAAAIHTHTALAQGAGVLEEIIVTAEKRETSLQDTPIAVSAFSGEELDRALINNTLDIQMNVPNMLMSKGNFTTANVSIRGIGNTAVGSAADSGTGVHFNGVYLNNPRIFETEFFDTERVEILRGPQGTLYGRNTTAGVINMITRKPDDEWGGDLQGQVGNYGATKFKGAINIPLGEQWSQRFSAFYSKRDGFVDNEYTGNDIDGRDMWALRSSTAWRGEDTDATLVINRFEEHSNRMRGSNQQCTKDLEGIIGCLPTSRGNEKTHSGATVTGFLTGIAGSILGTPFPVDDYANSLNPPDPRVQYLDFEPRYDVEDTIVSFEINHSFADLTLTSLTGYHRSDFNARNDYDFTRASEQWPVEVTVHAGPDGDFTVNRSWNSDRSTTQPEQFSQEFRLASDFEGDWNFLLGGFWMKYQGETHYYVYASGLELFGGLTGVPEDQRLFDNDTHSFDLDTWALFGELYWQTTDRLHMTLGLRYTEEEKSSLQRTVYLNFLDNPSAPNGGYNAFGGEWSEPTGKFNLTYDVSADIIAYATLARSYKSGGFNPISQNSPLLVEDPGLAYFEPEFINSIELGTKMTLMDNSMQANFTYFFYDYEDLQVSKIVAQTSLNENVNATIQGLEAELRWAPTANLILSLDASWLDTELDTFLSIDPANINLLGTTENIATTPNANVYLGSSCPNGTPASTAGCATDVTGNQLTNAPEFSFNLGISYTWALGSDKELTAASSYYYQDKFYTRIFNAPNDELDAWDVWNATLTLASLQNNWYTEAWVRNIGDEDHITGQYLGDQNVGLAYNQFLLEPRTYGLTVGYQF